MALSRQNRFRRHGRSFHSPMEDLTGSEGEDDVELGALPHERVPSWTYDGDGDEFAWEPSASHRETTDDTHATNTPRRRALLKSSKQHTTSWGARTRHRQGKRPYPSRTLSKLLSLIKTTLMIM